MTLQTKLAQIQTEFKAKKSRFNSFGKYYFRSAEDILEAIKPFLNKYQVTVTVNEKLLTNEPIPIIQATAAIHDEKGLMLKAKAICGVDLNQKGMQTPQQFGSASSYAKKYALGNLFLIDDTQDSDAINTHGKNGTTKQKLTNESLTKAKDYVAKGGSIETIKNKYIVSAKQEALLTQTL